MSWLLWIVLQWTFGYMHLFELWFLSWYMPKGGINWGDWEGYILLSHKKEGNNTIFSNMGKSRRLLYWVECQRKKNIKWYCLYVEFKQWYKWIYLQNRNRSTDVKNKLMVTKGEKGGWDKLGGLGRIYTTMYTTIYEIDN